MSWRTDRNGLDNSWASVTPDAVGRAGLAKAKMVRFAEGFCSKAAMLLAEPMAWTRDKRVVIDGICTGQDNST